MDSIYFFLKVFLFNIGSRRGNFYRVIGYNIIVKCLLVKVWKKVSCKSMRRGLFYFMKRRSRKKKR